MLKHLSLQHDTYWSIYSIILVISPYWYRVQLATLWILWQSALVITYCIASNRKRIKTLSITLYRQRNNHFSSLQPRLYNSVIPADADVPLSACRNIYMYIGDQIFLDFVQHSPKRVWAYLWHSPRVSIIRATCQCYHVTLIIANPWTVVGLEGFSLTHCGPMMPYGDIESGQHRLNRRGLLTGGTKPLPVPTLIHHQQCRLTFNWGQHK